ncbi:hypothetical protein K9L67_00215 [Candidatus Woesearchaeota archaeon]|nr:hypothetical protein [Candidatus Woesearchaeota archaeon]MCF7900630.1 hypothetical protein [Candidatus Woesearchaeota archaeon]MCF8013470.1 hypothetical protein [Candidatus Woesearchaeota archaeon]
MSFQKNVADSFKKVKEDVIRIQSTLDLILKENENLKKEIQKLKDKQIESEIKIKILSKN